MSMTKRAFILSILSVGLLSFVTSCSKIDPNNRLLPLEKSTANEGTRTVLLEDFTGEKCVNCPKAAKAIHDIQEIFGKNVVAVGLHGTTAFTPQGSTLFTEEAAAYYQRFANGVGLPTGIISRNVFSGKTTMPINEFATWSGLIKGLLASKPRLFSIHASATSDGIDAITSTVKVEAYAQENLPKNLMLQVWVTEDGITGIPQDGAEDKYNYVHNHVLRGSLNGIWGEAITLNQEVTSQRSLENITDIKNCHVVAFVYDAQTMEVYEATSITIK